MQLLIGEHGEALICALIGTLVILIVCGICLKQWSEIAPAYKADKSHSNREHIGQHQERYPMIEADEVIYADYKNDKFNYRDFIRAKDWNGKDITDRLKIYGTVDVLKKGLYRLRCVVVSESQLSCTKYVYVIVE